MISLSEAAARIREGKLVAFPTETVYGLGANALDAAAVAKIGYRNAGTVEFLRDEEGQLYFMEMNTRLQVEHPVTEMITGVDLVERQIRIAAHEPLGLRQEEIHFDGHAVECRINAEDPFDNFRGSPGVITRFSVPPEVEEGKCRLETHVREGATIPPYYDSMIGKLIALGRTREEAIDTMILALENFRIEGVKTTIPLHLQILRSEAFRSGRYDTGLVAELLANGVAAPTAAMPPSFSSPPSTAAAPKAGAAPKLPGAGRSR